MSGEVATPAVTPEPQAQPELQPGATPTDGGAPEGEGAQPAPQETPEEQTAKKQRFDKRFSDLTNRARQAELAAAEERGRRLALEEALRNGHQRQSEPVVQPQAPTAPDPAKYKGGKFDEQYVEDFAAWKAERAVEAAMAKAEEKQRAREREHALDAEISRGAERLEGTLDNARAAVASEQGEHFQNAPGILELAYVPVAQGGLPRHVVDAITQAERPVHVAEVIGRYPDHYLRELRSAHPLRAAQLIGAIDAEIKINLKAAKTGNGAQPAPKPAPQPSPSPIPTVTAAGAAPNKDPSKMSMAEYTQWRNG